MRTISLILFLVLLTIIIGLFLTGGLDLSKVDSTQGLIAGVLLVTISLLVVVMIMTTLFGGTNETLDVRIRWRATFSRPSWRSSGPSPDSTRVSDREQRTEDRIAERRRARLGGTFAGGVVDLQKTKIKDTDLAVLKDLPGVVS